MAVRWYLRYGLSYRDVEELLAERGITVDHVTVYRWVQRFTPRVHRGRPARSARSRRPVVRRRNIRQGRRSVDLPPPGDQHGQVIDVLLSERRDLAAARRFFTRALRGHDPGRGHHRPGPGLPAGPRRVDPLGTAHHRAVREQPGGNRSRAAEGPAAADARAETSPVRPGPGRRPRTRAEHPPRPLRHRNRHPRPPPAPHRCLIT